MTLSEYTIRRITAEETHAVRRAVLRPGRPAEETIYPGDEQATTIMFPLKPPCPSGLLRPRGPPHPALPW